MVIKVKHIKGRHYCNLSSLLKLYYVSLFRQYNTLEIHFSDKSKYDLKDGDQWDWNKIIGRGGLKYNRGERKTEQFLVWRYNIKDNQFEVTEYWRQDYKFDYTRKLKITDGSKPIVTDISFAYSFLPLGGYFGGNEVAPNDLEYKIIVRK